MTNPDGRPEPTARSRLLRSIGQVIKWVLFALVLLFVGRHAWRLWSEVDTTTIRLRWGWLAAATAVSILGWIPSAVYWRWVMAKLGAPAPWPEVWCAYYCGHLGKYVPGKAMTLIVRAAMLNSSRVPAAVAGFAATMETLAYIAAGTAMIALLLPSLLEMLPRLEGWTAGLYQLHWQIGLDVLVIAASLGGLLILSSASVHMASRFKKLVPALGALDRRLPANAALVGFVGFLAAWWLQGATLGLTLQALSDRPVDWSELPGWTATSAVALVGGFLAMFAPGGLGVREGLIMELLRGQTGPHEAVVAALVFRGVCFAAELLASGMLYLLVRYRRHGIPPSAASGG